MAVERPAGAIRFMFRINVQHYSCNFTPVSTFRVRIEQAKIRNKLFLVVNGQTGIGGRRIGDIRIKRGLLQARRSRNTVIEQLRRAPWHFDDREAVDPLKQRDLEQSGHPPDLNQQRSWRSA
jgi:hypothetical protein